MPLFDGKRRLSSRASKRRSDLKKEDLDFRIKYQHLCGTCERYFTDIQCCGMWGTRQVGEPIPTFTPTTVCKFPRFLGGYCKGTPRQFRG